MVIAALMDGLWPRDFKQEVARDVEFKGLQADPVEVFALMKKTSAKCKILEDERSGQRREKGEMENGYERNRTSSESRDARWSWPSAA